MARGLSDLQKWMLIRALENHDSGHQEAGHLYRNEVRADYYKFPVWDHWAGRVVENHTRESLRERFRQLFAKSQISNYAAVNLAITRAMIRLENRGLVQCWCPTYGHQGIGWITLTEKGIEQARLLAALALPVAQVQPIKDIGSP